MNITHILKRQITAQFLTAVTIASLLMSALPAAFFVAEAETITDSVSEIVVEAAPTPINDLCPDISGDQVSIDDCDVPIKPCPKVIGDYDDCGLPPVCVEGFESDDSLDCVPVPPTPLPTDATIIATKIVCDNEALLPNDGYSTITGTTATEFLASSEARTAGCRLQSDWNFQWALNGQDVQVDNAGAQGSPWVTSALTNENGQVAMVVSGAQLGSGKTISVREVMKENFLEFTGRNNPSNVTAELYCAGDAKNFDNLEWIPGVQSGDTYHCVAWNVADDNVKPVTTISEPVNGLSTTTDFRITIRSTDDKQLKKMVINIKDENGVQLISCLNETVSGTDQTRSCIVDVSALGEGNFQFKANAHDLAGNVSNTIFQTFTIASSDDVKPVTTISEPINGLSTTTDFRITIRSTDDRQLQKMVINLKNGDGSHLASCLNEAVAGTNQTRSCIVDVSALGEGNFQFKANAQDTAGNISNTIIQTFTIGSTEAPRCVNLLTNGSFENPEVINSNLWDKFASVTGWAISKVTGGDDTTLELHRDLFSNQAAHGAQYAELDGDQSTKVTQTVTTIPGATYELKWAFAGRHDIDAAQNQLSVLIDGSQVATEGPVNGFANLLPATWDRSSHVFTATDASTDISFADAGVSDSLGTYLDDAELCLVREPVPVATIVAEKVVCSSEVALPNWNKNPGGAPKVTAATAADWVAQSNGACRLVPDWEFEWALPAVHNPGDTLVGPGGAGWTTFGTTDANGRTQVTLTAEQIDGKSFVWMREVLKDGYLGFSFAAKPNNSNAVTAEMYCATDGVNYDNYDRVDGIALGKTHYCVAFNYEIPKPIEQCELTMYSDEETVVVERNGYAVETYNGNGAWTASIPGAAWIWDSFEATEIDTDDAPEIFTFEESFTVNNPTFADLDIAADNDYEISVNGVVKVPFAGISHASFLAKDDIDMLPFLATGDNIIRIKVKNFGSDNANYMQNPAGLLYKLFVKGDKDESCEVTTAPKVLIEKTFRIEGYKYEVLGDESNAPKAGWTINLYDEDSFEKSTTTDAQGYYYFEVPEGEWRVVEGTGGEDWNQVKVESNIESAVITDGESFCRFTLPYRFEMQSFAANLLIENPIIVRDFEIDTECDFYNVYEETDTEQPPVIDVCSNIEGPQSQIPSGYEKIGESNQCTLIPAIVTPEVRRSSSNGGGTRTRLPLVTPQALVLGASTSNLECGMYLQDYTRMGIENDAWEITKLQWFLAGQGFLVPVTGTFDSVTDKAVRDFQMKYQADVLTPWFTAGIVPHQNPTGWMYQLTRWKINNIVCPGSEVLPVLN